MLLLNRAGAGSRPSQVERRAVIGFANKCHSISFLWFVSLVVEVKRKARLGWAGRIERAGIINLFPRRTGWRQDDKLGRLLPADGIGQSLPQELIGEPGHRHVPVARLMVKNAD